MKQIIMSQKAPKAIGPYSQAVEAKGGFVFISGQLGLNPESMQFSGESTVEQAKQAFTNIHYILEAAGLGFEHIVKVTVLLKNIDDFATINEVYASCFTEPFPARAAWQVAALPKGALIEIEVIAARE
jgi:2-iminobutanoate/2-iminopropanoate deaminase